eukprot:jgi/Botrbrau1/13155/Bobra.0187s0103.1
MLAHKQNSNSSKHLERAHVHSESVCTSVLNVLEKFVRIRRRVHNARLHCS